MKFSVGSDGRSQKSAEVVIVPFFESSRGAVQAGGEKLDPLAPIILKDFTGKKEERVLLYGVEDQEKRFLLMGLGKESECHRDRVRLAYYQAARECLQKKWDHISCVLPRVKELDRVIPLLAAEGVCLANYQWPKSSEASYFKKVHFVGLENAWLEQLQKTQTIIEGVYFARDLINESAHTVTPVYLAQCAQRLAQESKSKLDVKILDLAAIKKERLGLLLAVAQGAAVEPRLIILSYRGKPKTKEHTVLIGKGVTFDTGGLNLKPTASMLSMKEDMAGGAVALATVATAASLNLPVNVTAIVPATENAIDALSYKPGDVFEAHDGTRVEIGDTDAEGRLILADAISYAMTYLNPTRMIDLATLTGSIVVALGEEIAGLFTNDDVLAQQLLKASQTVGEPLWHMPLYESYKEKLKSSVADLSNVGGRSGGSIIGALFLHHFVAKKGVPWAHIDCAGPAFLEKPIREWPKHGVGFGVRLLVEFLENISS